VIARSWISVAVGTVIAAVCFGATGGLNLSSATTAEMALTLGSAALVVAAVALDAPPRAALWGIGCTLAIFALAAFTALSVAWSVEPSDSWIEASRTLSYAAVFAGAIAFVRLAPSHWRSVIVGILLGTLFVSAYAVATKVIPESLASGPTLARLNAPFSYWNAVGLTAALGVPPCLWLGSRREGHGALSALAPPAICLLLIAAFLCYSRGTLIALALGLAFWFVVTPLRLRAIAVLAISAAGAAVVISWTFAQSALTTDYAPLGARSSSGHTLGALLVLVLVLCGAAGLVLRFSMVRNPPSAQARRRLGVALAVALALVPIVGILALSVSSRGLFGSISHDWSTLTNTKAAVPNNASRLTAVGSRRALYWSIALKAFDSNPFIGTGAGSYATVFLRYATSQATVTQAHSYVFQTLADLGLIGLALSLLLAGAWLYAALRSTGPFRAHDGVRPSESAERIGLLTLITCVVIFVVHASIDITWFVPGDALVALLCAGWVAGRGAHRVPLPQGRPRLALLRDKRLGAIAGVTVVFALMIAWSQWQPLRSDDAWNSAYEANTAHQYVLARADAETAASENPLDYQPLVELAAAQAGLHELAKARTTIERAVRLQPSNPQTWYDLAYFDFNALDAPAAALRDLAPAIFLDPESTYSQQLYTELLPAAETPAAQPTAHKHHTAKRAKTH
jgi:tetratricopeptide (TPR) repeat protein